MYICSILKSYLTWGLNGIESYSCYILDQVRDVRTLKKRRTYKRRHFFDNRPKIDSI